MLQPEEKLEEDQGERGAVIEHRFQPTHKYRYFNRTFERQSRSDQFGWTGWSPVSTVPPSVIKFLYNSGAFDAA